MKRGFTLIELSIVLVVIGLLIGGILVAQSMIDTAKVETFVREIGQFDAAVANFQTKYNSLPGDSKAFGCVNTNQGVCNNGVIEDGAGYTPSDNFADETANFWLNLQQNGFMSASGGTFSNTINGGHFSVTGSSPNSPKMPFGNNTGIVVGGMSTGSYGISSNHNYYIVCDFSGITNSTDSFIYNSCLQNSPIPTTDALAIDTKMDDGLSNMSDFNANNIDGKNVISYNYWQDNDAGYDPAGDARCTQYGFNTYNISHPNAKCTLLIKMFSTNNAQQ